MLNLFNVKEGVGKNGGVTQTSFNNSCEAQSLVKKLIMIIEFLCLYFFSKILNHKGCINLAEET